MTTDETEAGNAAEASSPPSAAPEVPSMGSLLQSLKLLIADLQGAVQERLTLLGLELRLAARALVRMVALAVIVVLLLCTAWALLMFGIYQALVVVGWMPLASIGLLLLLNILGAALAGWWALRCARRLTLPATTRRLRESPLREGSSNEPVDSARTAVG